MTPSEEEIATESVAAIPPGAPTAFVVEAVEGPARGQRIVLAEVGTRVLVGQAAVCDLRLEDRRISRRHLALERAADHVRVIDVGSTNGTFVGEVRVIELQARGGERIRIGDTVLEVVREAATEIARSAPKSAQFGRLVGQSPALRALVPALERLAHANVPVLIEGETGTGKEMLAESLHEQSARASGPFVVFDCTSVAASRVDIELFGCEASASPTHEAHVGLFEQANGGTLFLDELGELDAAVQPKLLRALERSEIRRVGGQAVVRVDVRILAATRRDLDHEVQEGRFRDDLYHRVAVARVELPPLRRRPSDVPLLAQHFARELGRDASAIPYEQMIRWQDHPWPGNVRELRNAVTRFFTVGDVAPLPAPLRSTATFEPLFALPIAVARQRLVDAFDRAYVERVLAANGGDIARAAEATGLARRQFFRLKAKASGGGPTDDS